MVLVSQRPMSSPSSFIRTCNWHFRTLRFAIPVIDVKNVFMFLIKNAFLLEDAFLKAFMYWNAIIF